MDSQIRSIHVPDWVSWSTICISALTLPTWMLSVYGLILQDVTDDPNSILDPFRGGLPLVTAFLIVVAGRNGLIRRDTLTTLRTSPRKQKLARLKETLLQPVKPGQPGYWLCITFEYMLFAAVALSMAAGVWPWLSGQADGGSFLTQSFPICSRLRCLSFPGSILQRFIAGWDT